MHGKHFLVRNNVKLGIEIVFLSCYYGEGTHSQQRWEIYSLRAFFANGYGKWISNLAVGYLAIIPQPERLREMFQTMFHVKHFIGLPLLQLTFVRNNIILQTT